ncbi:MAG: hypothetical protein S4CHLAM6_05740 [Chlamydiae bacterium]|nr:hypothetical protein [Chlamydiota bacterium]
MQPKRPKDQFSLFLDPSKRGSNTHSDSASSFTKEGSGDSKYLGGIKFAKTSMTAGLTKRQSFSEDPARVKRACNKAEKFFPSFAQIICLTSFTKFPVVEESREISNRNCKAPLSPLSTLSIKKSLAQS